MRVETIESNPTQSAVRLEVNSRDAPLLLPNMAHIGNLGLLEESLTALFCSQQCPGDVILKLYDLARSMRDAEVPVIGGFQSPMEKECLRLLMRGDQPIVVCPACGIQNMRIPREWCEALNKGRLLVLSPFPPTLRRPTAASAAQRNEFVADLATRVLIGHAAPPQQDGNLRPPPRRIGKPLFTLDSTANANLVDMGAEVVEAEQMLGDRCTTESLTRNHPLRS